MQRKGLTVVNIDNKLIAQLYDTIILKIEDNTITFNSGGWKTKHTKNCTNDLLPNGYKVFQKNYVWYIQTPKEVIEYIDHLTLVIGVV